MPANEEKIVIVDDNETFIELFMAISKNEGYKIIPFNSAKKSFDFLEKEPADLLISDVQMPDMTGTELLEKVKIINPEIPIILLTGFGSTELAIDAIKKGAFHYFEKPLDHQLELFWKTVGDALEKKKIKSQLTSLAEERAQLLSSKNHFVGNSDAIKNVFGQIKDVADISVTVLINGDTGTGKELVARAIHNTGNRRDHAFFAINCAAFTEGLLESELFGHEKGAFTGAVNTKQGLFEICHNGTIFLDEISEAPLNLQAKLLRVLENQSFTRVGGTTKVYSDFRIIAATNQDLAKAVEKGVFRKDLFYRLNVYIIDLPPLKKRREDILLIAEHYINKFSLEYRSSAKGIEENALLALKNYDWPGNVRELINIIERAVITCKNEKINIDNLPFADKEVLPDFSTLNLKEMEKFFIQMAIKRTSNNKTHAAALLGISRKTLIDKIRKFNNNEENNHLLC